MTSVEERVRQAQKKVEWPVRIHCYPPCAAHLLRRGQPLHVVVEVLFHLDLAARLLKVAPRLRLLSLLGKLS